MSSYVGQNVSCLQNIGKRRLRNPIATILLFLLSCIPLCTAKMSNVSHISCLRYVSNHLHPFADLKNHLYLFYLSIPTLHSHKGVLECMSKCIFPSFPLRSRLIVPHTVKYSTSLYDSCKIFILYCDLKSQLNVYKESQQFISLYLV